MKKIDWKSIMIFLIWLAMCIALSIDKHKRDKKEMAKWSDEQWENYYDAMENRSFRGE